MAIELKVPSVGESITEVFIGDWLVKEGAYVGKDKDVVELESDKATVNLVAPQGGVVSRVLKKKGDTAAIGEVIGYLEPQEAPQKSSEQPAPKQDKQPEAKAPAPKAPAEEQRLMPAAKRMMEEKGIQPGQVPASGPGGRTLKEDVIRYEQNKGNNQGETRASVPAKAPAPSNVPAPVSNVIPVEHLEEVVPMSPIRRKIAERLVEAQHTAALLTTFNEIDMTAVMDLRNRYKQSFVDRYNIKLGFMSFFVKAVIDALKQCPELNAEIRDTNIIYRNHYDIGIAIGGGKGLVVPILRNADQMSFAETELAIAEFAGRAQANKLRIEELMGGTFTISNGGVYGSLLSTPIVNPPQSGVLGMHSIQKRPVVIDDQIVIRQMMYIALTYDHRIVDGKEAVTFLKRIKDTIEDPTRILLEV